MRILTRLRRPSTPSLPRAGLLSPDLLRNSAAWTDATSRSRVVLRPRVEPPLCDPQLSRATPRRLFPGPAVRHRLAWFALFLLGLVLVPALLAPLLA